MTHHRRDPPPGRPADDRALANKLAAFALAVSEATVVTTDDLGPREVAGLLAISSGEGLSVGAVARATGLSPSAAVRLVDRLERAWLVRRNRRIAREVIVEATVRGSKRVEALSAARLAAAAAVLAPLAETERAVLSHLLDRMVGGLIAGPVGGGSDPVHHCRFCVRDLCDCGLHPDRGQDAAERR